MCVCVCVCLSERERKVGGEREGECGYMFESVRYLAERV